MGPHLLVVAQVLGTVTTFGTTLILDSVGRMDSTRMLSDERDGPAGLDGKFLPMKLPPNQDASGDYENNRSGGYRQHAHNDLHVEEEPGLHRAKGGRASA